MTTMLEATPSGDWVAPAAPDGPAGRIAFAWDDLALELDPAVGGRVTGIRLGGRNLLTGPEVDPGNYGSTFWTSPQSTWGWPPIPEVDHLAYKVALSPTGAVLRGGVSPVLGVEIEKRVAVHRARNAVVFDFAIHNRGEVPVRMAGWQITRVGPGGLTFFPTGAGTFAPSNLTVHEASGVTWYPFDAAQVTDHQKLFADGREGWIAHVDRDALLVKTFAVVPRAQQPPGEAQIEIYATPVHSYVEVEVQGAYDSIPPGGALLWRITWLVRRLPQGLPVAVGSGPLLELVRGLVSADADAAAVVGGRRPGA
jgi:hypothetical protein